MDFIPHPTGGLEPLDVPFVATLQYVYDAAFWSFPTSYGAVRDDDDWRTLPADELAALAQSWLYFGVMADFLGKPVNIHQFNQTREAQIEMGKVQVMKVVSAASFQTLLDEWLRFTVAPILNPAFMDENAPISSSLTEGDLWRNFQKRYRFLGKVLATCDELQQLPQAFDSDTIARIALSITVLCTTLRGILTEIMNPSTGMVTAWAMGGRADQLDWDRNDEEEATERVPPKEFVASGQSSIGTLLRQQMSSEGWCPFKMQHILSSHDYATTYYLSRLFNKSSQLDHGSCTESECVANNVDMSNYVTKHVHPACECSHLPFPEEEMRRIIKAGGIPLVRAKQVAEDKPPVLEVTQMNTATRYIAFSHVWSDGLGNPNANSLPECQVRRLQGYVDSSQPPEESSWVSYPAFNFDFRRTSYVNSPAKYFWLDTLCIPVGKEYDDLKFRAINQMAAIYSSAYEVLVLDSSFAHTSMQDAKVCEHIARLEVSPWMGRCWTFQEGCLAAVLNFQFFDSRLNPWRTKVGYSTFMGEQLDSTFFRFVRELANAIVFKLFIKRRMKFNASMLYDVETAIVAAISRPLLKRLSTSTNNTSVAFMDPSMTSEAQMTCDELVRCWNELTIRTTTKREDIHVILANLLRLGAHNILQMEKPQDRMRVILNSLKYLPLSFFLNSTVPRGDLAGNHRDRWLPLYPAGDSLSQAPRLKVTSDEADDIDLVSSRPNSDALNGLLEKKSGKLRIVYDCPITVTLMNCDLEDMKRVFNDLADIPVLNAHVLPKSWGLHIEQELVEKDVVEQQRPDPIEATVALYGLSTICNAVLPFILHLGTTGVGIAILATEYAQLSALARAGVILKLLMNFLVFAQFVFAHRAWVWNLAHLVTIALFTIGRFLAGRGNGHLTSLDRVFVYYGFVIHAILMVLNPVAMRLAKSKLSQEYMKTFDPDWTPEKQSWELKGIQMIKRWLMGDPNEL
ncbi:hypothetical protein KJ359_003792 [Pestalotiopsis sp. 9143b]|nr:hypothetical protein KJ359_003792 [Pestalotiopsis sp. 9143b]